jgi:hypothetical protein
VRSCNSRRSRDDHRAIHVDGKDGVIGEKGLLPFGVAAVGAVRVGVEELAQGEPVGGLGRADLCMDRHQ